MIQAESGQTNMMMSSLQGSIHRCSDGIGRGAFIPTDRAYYSACTQTPEGKGGTSTTTTTPCAKGAGGAHSERPRPSSEMIRMYRRHNVTAGIDTHRSDISFGRTTESVRGGKEGDPRAREATRSLSSGEVSGFSLRVADRFIAGQTRLESFSCSLLVTAPSCIAFQRFHHDPPAYLLSILYTS